MNIPKDPVMLLSFLNMQLRDHYPSLAEFAAASLADEEELKAKLKGIGYFYDEELNRFVAK